VLTLPLARARARVAVCCVRRMLEQRSLEADRVKERMLKAEG
jgi:hypothetical protein